MKIIRNLAICFIFNLIVSSVFSQTVNNVRPVVEEDKITVHYTIYKAKFYQSFNVSLYVSMDGGKTYQGKLKAVSGDVGENVTKGDKKIIWDVSKDVAALEGDVVFDVRAEVIEKERQKSLFLSYFGSYYSPIGLQFGQLGKTGWYISARANSKFAAKADYNTNNTGIIDYNGKGYYVLDDKELQKSYTISAGLNFQLGWDFFLYAGVGYGQNQLLWHINEYAYPDDEFLGDTYAKHTEYSYAGFEIETGFIIRTKKILISAGAANLAFKKDLTEFTFGLGYNF